MALAERIVSDTVALDQRLAAALDHQRQGRLTLARQLYEEIVARLPWQPTALTMLASIAYREGDEALGDGYVDRAILSYRRGLEGGATVPAAAAALANLLLARGRSGEAERWLASVDLPLNPIRSDARSFAERRDRARRHGRPPMLIVTVPKSASETIWNRVAEGLGLAQSHAALGLFPHCALVPGRSRAFAAGGIIAKEHLLPTPWNLRVLEACGLTRLVVHVRDPRQATLSWAHFVRDDVAARPLAPIWRSVVPKRRTLEGGFDAVLDWCIDHYLPLLIRFVSAWRGVEERSAERWQILWLSFEQFRTEPERYVQRFLGHYDIAPDDFAAAADAATVHLRRGSIDEWRHVYSRAQRKRAWRAIPGDLARRFDWRP